MSTVARASSAIAALMVLATACADAPPTDPAATRESAAKAEPSAAPAASSPVASAEQAAPPPSAPSAEPAPSPATSAPRTPPVDHGARSSSPAASPAPSSPPASALPTGPAAGKPWKVVASADADAGYHCNADYPNKFTTKGGTNVTYPEAKVAGACAGDRVVATIPFVPTASGPGTVVGTLSYGICDDKKTSCLMKKKDVTLAFTASP